MYLPKSYDRSIGWEVLLYHKFFVFVLDKRIANGRIPHSQCQYQVFTGIVALEESFANIQKCSLHMIDLAIIESGLQKKQFAGT